VYNFTLYFLAYTEEEPPGYPDLKNVEMRYRRLCPVPLLLAFAGQSFLPTSGFEWSFFKIQIRPVIVFFYHMLKKV
jgi:hypothetical protein